MGHANYMQRMGHSSCIRCDFETSDDMTFEQQDAALHAHLELAHPDWMTTPLTSEQLKRANMVLTPLSKKEIRDNRRI